jgi:DMSO/TMAO reductase YedYZ molybdopterin-dependent catalytic subunit
MSEMKNVNRRRFLTALLAAVSGAAAWQIHSKGILARLGAGKGSSGPASDRLPPGQHWVEDLIEYSAGGRPVIDEGSWRLRIEGLVENPLEYTLPRFQALPHVEMVKDFHCVTTWSIRDDRWKGVRLADLLGQARPRLEAKFVFTECYGGYSTNFPLAIGMRPEVLLADGYRERPLPHRFGGPVRLVVPPLYAYKSAKWVRRIVLLERDRPGFWERNGYSNQADPWKEQRWTRDDG